MTLSRYLTYPIKQNSQKCHARACHFRHPQVSRARVTLLSHKSVTRARDTMPHLGGKIYTYERRREKPTAWSSDLVQKHYHLVGIQQIISIPTHITKVTKTTPTTTSAMMTKTTTRTTALTETYCPLVVAVHIHTSSSPSRSIYLSS